MARLDLRKKLRACLATKKRLTVALKECHAKVAETRAKLQECLTAKKELSQKIALCHQKRDEARKKLKECEANKARLNAAIARVKAELESRGASAAASLLQRGDED